MGGATTTTLDKFAWISAHIAAGLPKDRVLAEAGFTAETWQAEQREWLELIRQRSERGAPELALRYSQKYLQFRAEADRAARAQLDGHSPYTLPGANTGHGPDGDASG